MHFGLNGFFFLAESLLLMTSRYSLFTLLVCACLALGPLAPAAAQSDVRVSLPDLTAQAASGTLTIPVRLDTPIDADDDVVSYSLELSYDASVVSVTGIDDAGTLTDGWTAVDNPNDPGVFLVNAISDPSDPALTGPAGATLVNLLVTVNGTGSTRLTFDDADLGPNANVGVSGTVSVGNVLVISEIHAAPASGTAGDANADGVTDAGDRFVEIVNTGSSTASFDGLQLAVDGTVAFTFPDGSVEPGDAAVVFGGGTPTGIPGADFVAPGGLALDASGATVSLLNASGQPIDGATYGPEADAGESIARAPEFTGAFALHTMNAPELYSPGRSFAGDPLPVELTAFSATLDGRDVVLEWTTMSESNNRGFAVQRAVEGRFTDVTFVRGAGTTDAPVTYSHRIRALEPGSHTFRLKQVDFDGTTTFTTPQRVDVPLSDAFELRDAAPNPFHSTAMLSLTVRDTQPVTAALFNVLGQRVRTLFDRTVPANSKQTIVIDGDGLPAGLYVYRVSGRDFRTTGRVVRVQ